MRMKHYEINLVVGIDKIKLLRYRVAMLPGTYGKVKEC